MPVGSSGGLRLIVFVGGINVDTSDVDEELVGLFECEYVDPSPMV